MQRRRQMRTLKTDVPVVSVEVADIEALLEAYVAVGTDRPKKAQRFGG